MQAFHLGSTEINGKDKPMKRFDLPPVWLFGFLGLAYGQSRLWPALSLSGPITGFLAGILVGAGVLAVLLAALEFRKRNTSIHPHETPTALIQSGVFKHSRNPIYLGFVFILSGMILFWDAVPSLVLIPIYLWGVEQRFISPEEDRMRKVFRADFARYCQKTRRWL